MSEFEGTVPIVTGGASGIGLATAVALRATGARVAVLDLRLEGLPDSLEGFVADVTDRPSVNAAVAATWRVRCRPRRRERRSRSTAASPIFASVRRQQGAES